MSSFEESYLGQLRKLVGSRMLLSPSVVAMIRDDAGRVLLIKRSDNGLWGAPAGGLELGESVYDCLIREVREETGLTVDAARLAGIYSGSRFAYTNMYGNELQLLLMVFDVHEWSGDPVKETDETTDLGFFDPDDLPPLSVEHYREILADYLAFNGEVTLK